MKRVTVRERPRDLVFVEETPVPQTFRMEPWSVSRHFRVIQVVETHQVRRMREGLMNASLSRAD